MLQPNKLQARPGEFNGMLTLPTLQDNLGYVVTRLSCSLNYQFPQILSLARKDDMVILFVSNQHIVVY